VTNVSVARSALTSALAGAAVVGVSLLGALLATFTVSDTSSISSTKPTVSFGIPAAELVVFPLVLLVSFAVFFLIGRRAARPIEEARRRQIQLAEDASHELRTPLTVVEGEASLALRGKRPSAEYRMALERILAESRRMRQQVDDLLWLARAETARAANSEFVWVDLALVADITVKRFQAVAAAKGQSISVNTSPGPHPVVAAPEAWLERLLGVLLDNACRYTPEGGQIRVTCTADEHGSRLAVEDSGPGIPPAERGRVFDRYHRATQTAGGSGLGLAIAMRVADETRGSLRLNGSELGGALFEVGWAKPAPNTRRLRPIL
jgi:signal transduction histidine kinase